MNLVVLGYTACFTSQAQTCVYAKQLQDGLQCIHPNREEIIQRTKLAFRLHDAGTSGNG